MKVFFVCSRLLTGIALLAAAMTTQAANQGMNRFGINAGYSVGGDIESGEFGYGLQGEFGINPNLGIELAISGFSDEVTELGVRIEQDITSIGLSGVFRTPLTDRLGGSILLGVNYNMVDMDVTYDEVEWGRGWGANADLDDAFGAHLGAGLGYKATDNMELFLEYRYTFLDLSGDLTVSNADYSVTDKVDGSYNFGLLKFGINILF